MDIETMKKLVAIVAKDYPIKKIILFGSRANNTNRPDSDIDLIVEFTAPVSLLTLSKLHIRLENLFNLNVDIVHGPLQPSDLLEVDKEIELYVA